jgi:5-methylthioadenosine/S-adenosylhomocysteine deaminase
MIRSGTVKFFDMYWQSASAGRAVVDSGMRALLTPPIFDMLDASTSDPVRKEALAALDELATMGPLVEPSIGPHAIYTVSAPTLEWAKGVSDERSIPLHIHLAETGGEVDDCVAANGTTPGHYVDGLGLLGPRTLLAHGCYFTDDEYDLIGERGATIVTNPVSNLKLANGRIFPYRKAAASGVPLGLGTDGASSNDNLDLFEEMKFFALLQKHEAVDPSVAPAHEVLELAQGQRSDLLGGRPVAVGEPADLLLVRTDAVEMTPGDLDPDLVYAASGHVVDTVVIAGEVVMRARHIDGEDEVRAEVRARVPRLTTD